MVLRRPTSVAGAPAGFEAVQDVVNFKAVVVLALRNVCSLERNTRAALEASVLAFVGKLMVWIV